MRGHRFLPLVKAMRKGDCGEFRVPGQSRRRAVPPFEVSVKPGLAQVGLPRLCGRL